MLATQTRSVVSIARSATVPMADIVDASSLRDRRTVTVAVCNTAAYAAHGGRSRAVNGVSVAVHRTKKDGSSTVGMTLHPVSAASGCSASR
jgi:hypothetical protein